MRFLREELLENADKRSRNLAMIKNAAVFSFIVYAISAAGKAPARDTGYTQMTQSIPSLMMQAQHGALKVFEQGMQVEQQAQLMAGYVPFK